MARLLNALEQSVFLNQVHPEVRDEINRIETYPDPSTIYSPLIYPNAGVSYKWPDGSYTLVWRDASRRWWFVDVTAKFASQDNKPEYVSADASFLKDVIDETHEMIAAGASIVGAVTPLLIALAVIVVINYLPRLR